MLYRQKLQYASLGILVSFCISTGASGDDIQVTSRTELAGALATAKAGTRIVIAPGEYRGGLSAKELRGTAEKPIVIMSADRQKPAVIQGGGSGLHLSDPAHVVIDGLLLERAEGNGLNIDDGGSAETPAIGIQLKNLVVRNVGPRGNRDGMKLSGLKDFVVENCTVENWGDSGSAIDMVGCHAGTVSGCQFRHDNAPNANGVQTKGGSRDISIRHCRFDHAGGRAVNVGGSTGLDYFRPKPEGFEAKDILVEDCTILGSMAPICFVGVDGALVQYNTIYRPTRWGLRILQENQDPQFKSCRNAKFQHNLVVFDSQELSTLVNVGPGTSPETFTFAKNVWRCIDRPAATRNFVRLPVAEEGGRYGVELSFVDEAKGDLRVREPADLDAGARSRD